jgi:hypothetical protein
MENSNARQYIVISLHSPESVFANQMHSRNPVAAGINPHNPIALPLRIIKRALEKHAAISIALICRQNV